MRILTGLAICGALCGQTVVVPSKAGEPLRIAAERLGKHLGGEKRSTVRLSTDSSIAVALGNEGYRIQGPRGGPLAITAAGERGLANGCYTLLRTLLTTHQTDPFQKAWDLQERPAFGVRGMSLAVFFLNLTGLSLDQFTPDQWKEHLDLLRLLNVNLVTVMPAAFYHGSDPETRKYQWQQENWKGALDYAHRLGMEFHMFIIQSLVPESVWWANPAARSIEAGYFGRNLCRLHANGDELIRKSQREVFSYFREMDGLEVMFHDGGADCDCPGRLAAPARYVMETMAKIETDLHAVAPRARLVFWNWLVAVKASQAQRRVEYAKNPAMRTYQDDVIQGLPERYWVLDVMPSSVARIAPQLLPEAMNAGYQAPLLRFQKRGHPTLHFLFHMDPEAGTEQALSVFPTPVMAWTKRELEESRKLGLPGVTGYRMTPRTRFLSDYAYARLAWNPSLSLEEIAREAAGMLVAGPAGVDGVAKAILDIERYHEHMDRRALASAADILRAGLPGRTDGRLRDLADGTASLLALHDLAATPKSDQKAYAAAQQKVIAAMKQAPIYRGYTSSEFWMNRVQTVSLGPRIGWWDSVLRPKIREAGSKKQ